MADEPGVVDKLPSRPLSYEEGQRLEAQESDRSWVRPESVIARDGEDVVVALMAVDRERGYSWLLGYDPELEGWSVVDEWAEAELEKEAFYERLEAWEAETFG
ncbi:MAG: hypothetical protein U5J98_06875 [Halobacteriales archaeon]|nr:hypothetical protein [Halobacteriales archaeon]